MMRQTIERMLVAGQIRALFNRGRVTGRWARRWLRAMEYGEDNAVLLVRLWRLDRGPGTRFRQRAPWLSRGPHRRSVYTRHLWPRRLGGYR